MDSDTVGTKEPEMQPHPELSKGHFIFHVQNLTQTHVAHAKL